MDSERIQTLLDKYWDGRTTLQEEVELRSLLSESADSQFEKEAQMFAYFSEQSRQSVSSAPDLQILVTERKKRRGSAYLWNVLKVAAVVTVLLVTGLLVREEIREDVNEGDQIVDTFNDPKEAFEETKKALLLISQNIGKGKSHASKVKAFSEAEEKVKSGTTKKNKDENI